MILKGSQRAGANQLAKHLINGEQNEHVTIHQIRGFMDDTVTGALNEAYALSRGTQCKQFMFSLSLNPPQNETVPVEVFEDALNRIEKKLGLENQPRIVVFHEKHGRRHAHCVWSRINIEEMKAINLPYTKLKLMDISKQLYLENGWQLPKGFINKAHKNPLNYTRAEWQQAARTNQNPKAIKATFQECWAASDSKDAFSAALKERGYFVARGDRRSFVAVDVFGEVYSLTRQIGVKKKELENRIGKADTLPSVEQVKKSISKQLSNILNNFLNEQNKDYKKSLKPLLDIKKAMTRQHRIDRSAQKSYQEKRWQKEEMQRVSRIRKGFRSIWDKINGRYWKSRKQNEKEAWLAHVRDRDERQNLIEKQLNQRQHLQTQLNLSHGKHEKDRENLIRNISHMNNPEPTTQEPSTQKDHIHDKFAEKNYKRELKPQNEKHFDNPDLEL
ncbi:MAG: hypothetical protein L3J75_07395 [Methylococcaceae bacterium]|nr:hypothetical protein [Methylococcaceae bacterium]